MKKVFFGTGLDQKFVRGSQVLRDRVLAGPVRWLGRVGVRPNFVTFLGLVFMGIAAAFFYRQDLVLGLCFFAFGLLADGLDGPLARFLKVDVYHGQVIDAVGDTLGLVCVVGGLFFGGSVGFGSAWVYGLNYVILEFFIFKNLFLGVPVTVPIRTRTWLFFVLLFDLIFGFRIVEYFLWVAGVYMIFGNVYLIFSYLAGVKKHE